MAKRKSYDRIARFDAHTPESVGLVNNPDQFIPIISAVQVADIPNQNADWEVVSDRKIILNQAKATEYIDLPVFPGERTVKSTRVQKIADNINAGTFNFTNITLASAYMNGVKYKINGQHTCWAVAYMQNDFAAQVREVVYKVKNITGLKRLYNTYDVGEPRTKGHQLHIEMCDLDITRDIPATIVGACARGCVYHFITSEFDRRRLDASQIGAYVQKEHAALFQTIAQHVTVWKKDNKALAVLPVVAAMFATFNTVTSKSIEFWSAVATGLNFNTKTDPRYQLRKQLDSRIKVRGTNPDQRKHVRITDEAVYTSCINAWNKWRRGETAQSAIPPTKKRFNAI